MVVVAVASVRSSSSSEPARCSAPRLPTAETSARRKVTVSIPERTLPTAIAPRHRPKTAGNASTCGTEVTRTIRMTHSMKRTAREVVAAAKMAHSRLRISRTQTARPRPALQKSSKPSASVGVERSTEGLAQATSKCTVAVIAVKSSRAYAKRHLCPSPRRIHAPKRRRSDSLIPLKALQVRYAAIGCLRGRALRACNCSKVTASVTGATFGPARPGVADPTSTRAANVTNGIMADASKPMYT
jgi:hypothetical protein